MKRYRGANEFLGSSVRYCFWITDADAERALVIAPIARRARAGTRHALAGIYSTRRQWPIVPIAFSSVPTRTAVDPHPVALVGAPNDRPDGILRFSHGDLKRRQCCLRGRAVAVRVAPVADPHHLGRNCWRQTQDRLPLLRESSVTTPFRFHHSPIETRARLTEHALAILEARERHSDRTLGDLYIPDKMPARSAARPRGPRQDSRRSVWRHDAIQHRAASRFSSPSTSHMTAAGTEAA